MDNDGRCPAGCCQGSVASPPEIEFPKPKTSSRLLGSGVEYLAYLICAWIITILDAMSGGLAGLLSLIVVLLIVLRDFQGGTFSLAKRVCNMRVVDHRTGESASNFQGLLRNSYYLVLLLIATVLPFVDWFSSTFFTMFIALDVMMILANPRGRRLGDLLASTQVVQARS